MNIVLIADFAFKTADVVGVHSNKKIAEQQRASFPERFGDGSRAIVVTKTELNRKFNKWDVTV